MWRFLEARVEAEEPEAEAAEAAEAASMVVGWWTMGGYGGNLN